MYIRIYSTENRKIKYNEGKLQKSITPQPLALLTSSQRDFVVVIM